MPWREQVGLSYSSGLPHFFLEHRLCFSAEEQMFRLGDPCQLRASRVCDAPVYLTISKTNKDKHSNAPPTVRPKGQVAVANLSSRHLDLMI